MLAPVQYIDGWITVPYSGPDLARCYMRVDNEWKPAFKDWHEDQRVLRVRPPQNPNRDVFIVWVDVSGTITKAGSVRVS